MPDFSILYSFRRCPYAMRARMGLLYAGCVVELREVLLKQKPQTLRDISNKATVPVLLHPDGTLLEESLDILHWALDQRDPDGWKVYNAVDLNSMKALVEENDFSFKDHLDRYKYADRFPENSQQEYRAAGEVFLRKLELRLNNASYLFGERISYADIAIFPFIRQFSKVDEPWFDESPYVNLRAWLKDQMSSELFLAIMKKNKVWQVDDPILLFGNIRASTS